MRTHCDRCKKEFVKGETYGILNTPTSVLGRLETIQEVVCMECFNKAAEESHKQWLLSRNKE